MALAMRVKITLRVPRPGLVVGVRELRLHLEGLQQHREAQPVLLDWFRGLFVLSSSNVQTSIRSSGSCPARFPAAGRPGTGAAGQERLLPSRRRAGCAFGVAVELGHELAVSCAGGGELVVAFLEFQFQVGRLLFEGGDSGLELLGVIGAADAGLAPGLFASASLGRSSRRRTWAARRGRTSASARVPR